MESREILLAVALKCNNDWNRIYSYLSDNPQHIEESLTEEDIARAKNFTGNYVSFLDAEYPERLKQKPKPPFVLYYEGDINLLKRVDENGCKNHLVFLHGPNCFNIPQTDLCVITDDNKIDICGGLKVWFNTDSMSVDRYGLAAGLCYNIVGTKEYNLNSRSWFLGITVANAIYLGANVFLKPTTFPSYNNKLIKEGCFLIDSYSDIRISAQENTSGESNLEF